MLSEQNPEGQLTALTSGAVSMTYAYSSSQNNGKITGQTDNISGEQVVYAYDALNRLASAAATSGSWGQSYGYDGFGNLQTQTVTAGSAPSLSVVYNASNNLQTTDCADANGNIWGNTTGGGSCGSLSPTYNYDASNRIVTAAGGVQYGYAPGNKRVWKGITTGGNLSTDVITFWSVTGQKLGDYNVSGDPSVLYDWVDYDTPAPIVTAALGTADYYFGHKLIAKGGTYVGTDRLGSFGKFYPWGQEKPSATGNNTEKFTGYFRDAETGNDYAINRYHQPGMGRFFTTDPKRNSARSSTPNTWNRYAYGVGDPINKRDPRGLDCEDAFNRLGSDGTQMISGPSAEQDPVGGSGDCVAGDPNANFATGGDGAGDNSVTVTDTADDVDPNDSDSEDLCGSTFCDSWYTFTYDDTSQNPNQPTAPSSVVNQNPCVSNIINAVNKQFGTSLTPKNVTEPPYNFSTGAPPGRGTLNLNLSVPGSSHGSSISPGRFPLHWWTVIIGFGATLHVPSSRGNADSPNTLKFTPRQFTAHLDTAYPYNPIGFGLHVLLDMTPLGGYKPCP